jgi:hypothetical protein
MSLSRWCCPRWWPKALLLLFLSVLGGLLNQIIAQGGSFVLADTLWYIVGTYSLAVLAHYGLLSPLQVTGAQGTIAKNLPDGIGPPGTASAPKVVPSDIVRRPDEKYGL